MLLIGVCDAFLFIVVTFFRLRFTALFFGVAVDNDPIGCEGLLLLLRRSLLAFTEPLLVENASTIASIFACEWYLQTFPNSG